MKAVMSTKKSTSDFDSISSKSARLEAEEERDRHQSGKDLEESEQRIARLEEKIAKKGSGELNVLAKAGADCKSILTLLATAADEEEIKEWAKRARLRQEVLRSAASRMQTLADEAEKLARDPFSIAEAYLIPGAYGGLLGTEMPAPLWDSPKFQSVIVGMRQLSREWKNETTVFGRVLREYGDKRINPNIPLLLCCLCRSLNIPEPIHWAELANLLAYAFEAAGKKRSVSTDSLQRTWKKYGKKMLRAFLVEMARLRPEPPGTSWPPID
jgi:hypothetical protein